MKFNTLLFLLLAVKFSVFSQNPADVSHYFGEYPGFVNKVYTTAAQNDGKFIVGGEFDKYNGKLENKLIRLNPDGSKDLTFISGNGFEGNCYVKSIIIQPDSKILVAGSFINYNGINKKYILRLNSNGSVDSSFNTTGSGLNSAADVIALQPDGKIILGGWFTSYNGTTANRIVRLNPDGSKDTSFNSGTGFNNTIHTINLQTDGKIIVCGRYTSYNNLTKNRIVRLNIDGSIDTSFNSGIGFNSNVNSVHIQSDNKIIIGGEFTSYSGISENRIIRLNNDGSKDTTFNIGNGANWIVNSINQQSDGKIIIGGEFTLFNNIIKKEIIRINNDGSIDNTFNIGSGFEGGIITLSIDSNDKIIVGGSFISFNGNPMNKIILLNSDGSKDSNFNLGNGLNWSVNKFAIQDDNKIIICGSFNSYKRLFTPNILRLNVDGSVDQSFNTIGEGFNSAVTTVKILPNGKVIIGGWFDTYNGIISKKIIRLNTDGSKDNSFNIGTGFNNTVEDVVIQDDGKIIVGGSFTLYNNTPVNGLIRLNSDGSIDNSFNIGSGFVYNINGLLGCVYSIAIQSESKILVGGRFTSYNDINQKALVRLNSDGSFDNSLNFLGSGFENSSSNPTIYEITIQTDGKILVGGTFTSFNGNNENCLIRLNANGSKDNDFNIGNGFLNGFAGSIVLQPNGKIIIGGPFDTFNGQTEKRLIRLNSDGSKDLSFDTGSGFEEYPVYQVGLLNNGEILVAGLSTTYKNNSNSAFLIKLYGDSILSNYDFSNCTTFSLYPNPVKDNFHVQFDNFSTINSVKIYDLLGKLVYETTAKTIPVSNLSKGLYIVKVTTEVGEFTKKFIKE